jgi:hypothetical protein
MIESESEQYDIQLKSPMGWIKVKAGLTPDTKNTFHGEAKLMGITVPITDCVKDGGNYRFKASPKLPFGVLDVTISADIHPDGSVTGVADAPRHKPMEIKGQRVQA